jgi:hypothetical protein
MVFDLLKTTAQKLTDINVPYMLSGSVAMSFYSVSRTTRDIDIVAYLRDTDIDNLLLAFQGYYFHRLTIEDEIDKKGIFNIISNDTGFKIDFIVLRLDEYSQVAFSRRQLMRLDDAEYYVIAIEDLIIAKLKWIQQLYSERQFTDIQNLMPNQKIDREYLLFWIDKLRLNTFNLFK